jgi:AcrR family transcriptional regulator
VPRVRSGDYDAKTQAILDSAAALFAKVGYPNTKMQDIAQACGATKSMLYHYFPTKDDLLAAMLSEHMDAVIVGLEEALLVDGTPEARLLALVQAYTQKSALTRRRHVTTMNDLKFLPKALQTPILEAQSQVVDMASQLLRALKPGMPERVYKPYTMMLIGILNWTDFWFRPNGPMKATELCERITRLFLNGYLAATPDA